MKLRLRHLFLLVFISFFSIETMAKLMVVYPNVNGDGVNLFGYAALKLALENSGVDFELTVSNYSVSPLRIRKLIKDNKVSIADFGTSKEFESEFLPIYIPIDLGLNGWRIFVIHGDNQSIFDRIKTMENLREKVAGQGRGWSDVSILKNAGLEVIEAPNIINLFKMLDSNRFDYFPLGANEAHYLLETYKNKKLNSKLTIESNIVLIYPFGRLFFVNHDNRELYDAVRIGLITSFENGSFFELFKHHKSNKALFTKAYLSSRVRIIIDNNNMTEAFKKIPQKYFFNLKMLED
ncbi:transporter substrate-binding domain-containing protein [Shewanella sp. VB17]|uniref:transporter substrate-binding domain-containing protein n=1 Tax=Shewanella sp. VB17 TaxID=2739432 RepID=UPI001565338F|nr:transporter substrate-binding domain-containing protein [Shewanella sp. VB17]NRD75455.1 transporter substrate-binding domain-containing protein [Shewanella sp. VB17]